jgi:hypothetical protein
VPTFTCGFLRSNFSFDMTCNLKADYLDNAAPQGRFSKIPAIPRDRAGQPFLMTASAMLFGASA